MTLGELFLDPPAATLADLWVTLARAFLLPLEPDHWRAMHTDLPLDLADWRCELDLSHAPRADELLAALAAYDEHEALLAHYSSLFYAPPIRVQLNLGHYLDATRGGQVRDTLDRWHAAYGLDRSPAYHDLSDHLAAVLEFLGMIAGLDERVLAAEFAHAFLLPTLPRSIHSMEREGAFDSPYLWLLRFTLAALERVYPPLEPTPEPARPGASGKPAGGPLSPAPGLGGAPGLTTAAA